MARLENYGAPPSYDPMDGMADSIAREALTSTGSFRRSQRRVAQHLKKTAKKLANGFGPKNMPRMTRGKRPKGQNGATGKGGSRGF